ncbi:MULTISPECIES: hypothetical protein [unclassified Rhizobium]|jgi:hypothetical protein|uniref:hypothetical protein n=1 Tax=unclassified Rhizobium TaxID=2613769 RepID=UPI00068B4AD4|nr:MULTISPECIES: hypothetical protein [unclassified Rhizobium]MBN8949079.1 hypothetical protein [Rhizobium tropici]RKD72343.1 hypothetical protein BJ928_102126 [Rhizobium sp. WW_1]
MIWFDALLEKTADDDLLRRCIAVVLNIDARGLDVIHDMDQISDAPVTCLVTLEALGDYSQMISIYHTGDLHPMPILEAANRLARLLETSLLVANDDTANPYSFIRISRLGQASVVLVDPDELDKNGRYVIAGQNPVAS